MRREFDSVVIRPFVKLVEFRSAQVRVAVVERRDVPLSHLVLHVQPRIAAERLHHGVQRSARLLRVLHFLGVVSLLRLPGRRNGQHRHCQHHHQKFQHSLSPCNRFVSSPKSLVIRARHVEITIPTSRSKIAASPYPTSTAPPFTFSTSPLINPASGVHRNSTGPAISRGFPTLPTGIPASNSRPQRWIIQRRRRHLCSHPPRSHAIHAKSPWRQLTRQALCQTDQRAFRHGIVRVERLAALPGRRADQHDVPLCAVGSNRRRPLQFHLRHRRLHQPKHRVQIHRQCAPPLLLGHQLNRRILRLPHAVIDHQSIQPPERLHRRVHQPPPFRGSAQFLLHRHATAGPPHSPSVQAPVPSPADS